MIFVYTIFITDTCYHVNINGYIIHVHKTNSVVYFQNELKLTLNHLANIDKHLTIIPYLSL